MLIELALPNIQDATAEPFVIARVAEPRRCPALGRPLQSAVSRLVAGMPVVLVHRDFAGEVRTYGDAAASQTLVGLDLDAQHWVPFELTEPTSSFATERLAA